MSTTDPDTLWLFIGNPENRRCEFFLAALSTHSQRHIISYQQLLATDDIAGMLMAQLAPFQFSRLNIKIDSAGENFAVEKALLCQVNLPRYQALVDDKGRFAHLHDWFNGFSALLTRLENALLEVLLQRQLPRDSLHYLNTPAAITLMTDKLACQRYLLRCGVAVPALLPQMQSFRQLVAYMMQQRCFQVFIKTRFGSSASGVVALRLSPRGQMVARTSLELVTDGTAYSFYNSLKIRTYQHPDQIALLFDAIMAQQGYVERWQPKPVLQGKHFDLRIVVLGGKAMHYIARCSSSPMTNLHLGNCRGDILQLENGPQLLAQAKQVAEQAAACIPGAGCIGADVICAAKGAKVIELNAFGDLLPNVLHQGLSSYEAQVRLMSCC